MTQQEKGVRPACALPYELYADGNLNASKTLELSLTAANKFLQNTHGAPFIVHARNYDGKDFIERTYTAIAGDTLKDTWQLSNFKDGIYELEVTGPNGFYRKFKGNNDDALFNVLANYKTDLNNKLNGNIELLLQNNSNLVVSYQIKDNAYKAAIISKQLAANTEQNIMLDLSKNFNWYDFSISINGNDIFEKRYAGHVETGKESKSDPVMGNV